MSDQTTIHDIECLCRNDNLEASIKECLDKYQAYASTHNFQALEDTPLSSCVEAMEVKEKEDEGIRFLDFLCELLAILFPGHAETQDIDKRGHASSPLILHKSDSCYIQPMIWNPGVIYKNRDE